MNDLVKNSIDSRKNAILSSYNITEKSMLDKIESLFKRMYEFGESCSDAMDFENKLATSELNQEYIQLFTEIATNCSQIERQREGNRYVKSDAEYVADEIASEIRYQTRNATEPIRRQMRQEAYDKARNMPVIGDIMTAKQHYDFFSRFKKKKEKNEEVEDTEKNQNTDK